MTRVFFVFIKVAIELERIHLTGNPTIMQALQ